MTFSSYSTAAAATVAAAAVALFNKDTIFDDGIFYH